MASDPTKKLEKALSEDDITMLVEMAQEEEKGEQKSPGKK